jgi:carbamoylphosphate synthase large subunit
LIPTAVSKIISINFLDIKTLDDKNIYNIEKKPTINLCDSYAQHYLDNGFPRELMINPPDILEGTRKLEMHKKLLNKNYVPKTVFSIEDAKKHLKFPIIIKASHSHSAQGVFKVDSIEDIEKTYKEIEKLNKKTKKDESLIPDVFSETINIAKE